MRSALCLSGLARNDIPRILETLHKYILVPNKPDIFLSLGINKSNNLSEKFVKKLGQLDDANIISYEIEQDKEITIKSKKVIEEMLTKDTPYIKRDKKQGRRKYTERYLQQLYFIYKCNSLKREYEIANNFRYDWVIRARADSFYRDSVRLSELEDNNYLYIPIHKLFGGGAYDRFGFGSSKIMDIYSHRYIIIKKGLFETALSELATPERQLQFWIGKARIKCAPYKKVSSRIKNFNCLT